MGSYVDIWGDVTSGGEPLGQEMLSGIWDGRILPKWVPPRINVALSIFHDWLRQWPIWRD